MSNIETLEQDAADCELDCPHGLDSREAKLEDGFIDSLNGPGFAKMNRQFKINDGQPTRVQVDRFNIAMRKLPDRIEFSEEDIETGKFIQAHTDTTEDGMRKFAKSFGVDFDKTVSDAACNFQGSTIPQCPPLRDADIEQLVEDDDKALSDVRTYFPSLYDMTGADALKFPNKSGVYM